MGKKISELTNRQQLSGNEDLPFQEGQDNGSITIHSLNEYISNSNVNQAINQIKQAEQQAISNFSSQKVSPEMLSESTKQLINASGGGTITNLADDEDIESVGQDLKVLKFADRAYNPVAHIGKGYKILRRNIVNGKNILTQEMVNQPHTIYMIQYDFDLNGVQITIPENCILKFDGGSLSNGIINCNNTIIQADPYNIFTNIKDKVTEQVYKTYIRVTKELLNSIHGVNNLLIELTYTGSIGSKWEEFDDELLYKPYIRTKGTFAQKPLSSQGIQQGFSYFCTDKQTVEGSRSGIMIYYAGNDTWVDALGRYV